MAEIGTAAIGMVATGAAIGITTTTITLIILFSSAVLAFPSSAIRMAMDITLTAMAMLPTVTDMAPGIMGMGQDTTDMATATTVMAITVTATTAMASTAAVITLAIAPTEVDQALPSAATIISGRLLSWSNRRNNGISDALCLARLPARSRNGQYSTRLSWMGD